jgi:hypothetical protein
MTARLHVLMQYADNLNHTRRHRAVVEDVHGLFHLGLHVAGPCMPHMKAADIAEKIISAARRATFRIIRHLAHRCRDQRRITALARGTPSFRASGQNPRKVRFRQMRQAKTRHQSACVFARSDHKPLKIGLKVGVIDLDEFTSIEGIHSGLDMKTQHSKL